MSQLFVDNIKEEQVVLSEHHGENVTGVVTATTLMVMSLVEQFQAPQELSLVMFRLVAH